MSVGLDFDKTEDCLLAREGSGLLNSPKPGVFIDLKLSFYPFSSILNSMSTAFPFLLSDEKSGFSYI